MQQINRLWQYLEKRRHRQFYLLFILMMLASLTEIISIGAILPFLGVITAPEQVFQNSIIQPIIKILDITEPTQLLAPMTIVFVVAVLITGAIRLLLLYTMTRLSYATGADLSINIYRRTLYQDYSKHVARNSSEVINGIISKTNTVVGGVITPTLTLISSIILMIAIMSALFTIDSTIALSATMGFGLIYLIVIKITRQQLQENSNCVAEQSTQMIKALQEGLGGIRDVLIDGSQQFYCQIYRNADLPLREASASNSFISGSPRYAIESIGMALIAVLAYSMSLREEGLVTAIPVLGALGLGAQRLLPALQQAYSAYSTMKGAHTSFEDVLNLLDQPLPNYANQPQPTPITFKKDIRLENLSFRYSKETPWVLRNIDLKLNKGARIGFMGVTGSGKSTLLDIVMGLLSSTEGQFFVDDEPINAENCRSWQAHIAHVPQNIYLSDSTIEENIAFGIPKEQINHQQVKKAAQQAQIAELIEKWKEGYQTFVGERGIRLSGGQRQRIGIARALYKQADVLIFDEATSALDNETEYAVMEAIEELDRELTILIIAHRLTTLKGCDQIVTLGNNIIIYTGSYQECIDISNK
jgi:ATP-binding cassette, subfamily B, bacterial PglK